MVNVPQALINFVKDREGPFQAKAFSDYAQYSIGWGTKANSPSEVITKEEGERRLVQELSKAVSSVLAAVKVPLNDNQVAALASLAYNAGTIAQYPKLMAALNSGNFAAAADQFLDINKATNGQVLAGLTTRRKLERELFLGKSSGSNTIQTEYTPDTKSLKPNSSDIITQATNTLNSAIQSILLSGKNCPPPEWNQRDRIIYSGCKTLTAAPLLGNALGSGYAAPAINSLGSSSSPSTSTNSSEATKAIPNNNKPYEGTLKPGGFIVPIKSYRVTSPFGYRIHPIKGTRKMHNGIDLGNTTPSPPIYAAADAVVQFSGRQGGYGNFVILKHAGGVLTRYGHCSRLIVKTGEVVKQGQLIAYVGTTGSSTAEHLHLEVLPDGVNFADPRNYFKF